MYRRPKFLEILLDIRQEMAAEADHDVDLFVEMVRSGKLPEPRLRTVSRSTDEPLDGPVRNPERPVVRRGVTKK